MGRADSRTCKGQAMTDAELFEIELAAQWEAGRKRHGELIGDAEFCPEGFGRDKVTPETLLAVVRELRACRSKLRGCEQQKSLSLKFRSF